MHTIDLVNLARALDPVILMRDAGFEPDDWQARVLRSSAPRLMLCCARQTGKSITTAAKSVWRATFVPGSLVLLISRSKYQSNELFMKVRRIHDALGRPGGIARELVSEIWLKNDSRIIALPNNPETVRGYSDCALLVLDEASRIPHSIIIATQPMILASRGDIIMLSTPAGQGNFFYEQWSDVHSPWERIIARASDCPRFDPKQLAQMRHDFGPAMAAQEFDCEFLRDDQQVFSTDSIDAMFDTDEEAITLPPLSRGGYNQ
jgi:hypothetical protein